MEQKLKEFYMTEFPTDDLGASINPNATFVGLFDTLDFRQDVYDYIGVIDSLIRERLFSKLAELIGTDYKYVYDQWLLGAR